MNLRNFFTETIENGGATFNINTGEFNPKVGFTVALPQYSQEIPIKDFTKTTVKDFINANSIALSNDNNFLGSWLDKDGIVCLDVVELIVDKRLAISLGMRRNQLAIYDNFNEVVIDLPTNQTSGTYTQQQSYITSVMNKLCS